MGDQYRQFHEKRAHQRLSICRKIRFVVGADIYRGLVGDISGGGISIISKHKIVLVAVVALMIPPMSRTVQYCSSCGKDFFKTGLRLLEDNPSHITAPNV